MERIGRDAPGCVTASRSSCQGTASTFPIRGPLRPTVTPPRWPRPDQADESSQHVPLTTARRPRLRLAYGARRVLAICIRRAGAHRPSQVLHTHIIDRRGHRRSLAALSRQPQRRVAVVVNALLARSTPLAAAASRHANARKTHFGLARGIPRPKRSACSSSPPRPRSAPGP